jgi:hypothetical protein
MSIAQLNGLAQVKFAMEDALDSFDREGYSLLTQLRMEIVASLENEAMAKMAGGMTEEQAQVCDIYTRFLLDTNEKLKRGVLAAEVERDGGIVDGWCGPE